MINPAVCQASDTGALIQVKSVRKVFRSRASGLSSGETREYTAIKDVSLDIKAGETLGCVGETGSGKSTLGRIVLNLVPADAGEVLFDGVKVSGLSSVAMRPFRRKMQIVFQDSLQALNPRRTVIESMLQPLGNYGISGPAALAQIAKVFDFVGLNSAHASRYPHEFSGGQCQRIGIARALLLQPRFIFLDEPISALDVSIQAQIINLLQLVREQLSLTYLFVSHDMSIVRYVSDRILVLYHGHVLEVGASDDVYDRPLHPYTQTLRAAVLDLGADTGWQEVASSTGARIDRDAPETDTVPSVEAHTGCVYARLCTYRFRQCDDTSPRLQEVEPGRFVACHLHAASA